MSSMQPIMVCSCRESQRVLARLESEREGTWSDYMQLKITAWKHSEINGRMLLHLVDYEVVGQD